MRGSKDETAEGNSPQILHTQTSSARTQAKHDIEAYLASRLQEHFDATTHVNDDNYEAVLALLKSDATPNFVFSGRPSFVRISLEQHLREHLLRRKTFPNSRLSIVDISSVVDVAGGVARSIVNYTIAGQPEGIVNRAIAVWKWVYIDGKWRVSSVKDMTGFSMS